ncbi:(5-formylfuran-3-yl)methyl phosphate synthase [Methylosarcina fibrata]|uniref:(5-formylfuran-3-yl)methyl phosphate synthase n=1 Tax=Methylosarcina fibrata TaxID=105972 RepID=UPI00036B0D78|nr:(5-formylfuran-3-yl)methyl phosphate synthase [Methylosarcina fibrata]
MTGMLASVQSLEETIMALSAQVDIIDLKQPASGALGALDRDAIRRICDYCNGRRPVSATIGDLPVRPDPVFAAVKAMQETGVDYIKIGFFPGGDPEGTAHKLSVLTGRQPALIGVLFADTEPDFALIDLLKSSGFTGVMLDTMDKSKGSLTEVMRPETIGQFVGLARSRRLLCGLAGSLRLADIPELTALRPDYLGFRGALCVGSARTARLDPESTVRIREAVAAAAGRCAKARPVDFEAEFGGIRNVSGK